MSIPVFFAWMALCCGYAIWRGGAPERIAAGLQMGAYVLTLLLHYAIDAAGYRSASVATAAIDVLLAALAMLGWRSTRFWPLWIAAWQLAAIVAHLAKTIDPAMLASGYAIQAQFWAYPMLAATAAGAWRHRQRLRQGRDDPSWKSAIDPRVAH
ncbi:hypothetical protein GGQ80_001450 [Sphingomonas jinjuensis]|uniref:Uncharacterized protein n=1 Tax=Sphingomonas jinjuensis TaxID=535907 RepID=A0A840FHW8_9SPHN|nr:hypothetical protein [Sphingomonas jinjuensis]MBB4153548.1 hypothetical protein [Sphingomonas jinjuensis]